MTRNIKTRCIHHETDEENPTRQRLEQMAAQLEGGIDAFHVREKIRTGNGETGSSNKTLDNGEKKRIIQSIQNLHIK